MLFFPFLKINKQIDICLSFWYYQNKMQQSDQLLITSLKDFISLPQNVQSLSDIKGDEMFIIALTFLQAMGIDVKQIKQIEKQKFRSTTKLNQKIHKQLQIELELNDLLNPTTNFTRKTLLTFLSKLGSAQGQNQKVNLGKINEEDSEKRKKKKILMNWLQDQWIHPSLISQPKPIYSAYLYPLSINRKTIKANLLPQLKNKTIKQNALSILTTSINHNLMKQRQNELNTGISRKKGEQSANIQTGKLIASNFEDWNMAQQRLNKIKRKLEKDKETADAKKAEQEEKMNKIVEEKPQLQVQSVFQAEVEEKIQEKQKQKEIVKQIATVQTNSSISSQIQSIQNPLERLQKQAELKKSQYENMIQQLLYQLNEKKQESQSLSAKKERIETQIQKDEQKFIQIKSKTDELKKQVEKKQLVLQAVQSPKQIQEQIKKFQEDIVLIEQQVKQEVQTTTTAIQTMQVQSDRKIQALKDLKIKLHRIENQYKQICEQIDDKTQRKGKIKIAKSGISRNYYSKRISQIDKRWRQTQKQVQKIKKDLEIMKEKTHSLTDAGDYMERQIQNLILADKSSKTEQQTKALKEIFTKCQNCYKTTLQTLNKINEIKEQTREYEIKVHSLTSQNYKQGIQKVNTALLELKKQIQEISKKQGKK